MSFELLFPNVTSFDTNIIPTTHFFRFHSTVDAFQGREACIVIYSCVRAGGKGSGIGFLSDVQRMNVALTRAKNYLFVIARRRSIVVNPYWRDLVGYASEKNAIINVPINRSRAKGNDKKEMFPNLMRLTPAGQPSL